MRQANKLFFIHGLLFTCLILAICWIGFGWRWFQGDPLPQEMMYIALLVIWMLGLAGIYLVSRWFGTRWAALLEQTEEALYAPSASRIEIAGSDEVASLAGLIERMRAHWVNGTEARDRQVSDAAHELRTPIAIIRAQLEAMLEGSMRLTQENIVPLYDETTRLTKLIQDLSLLSLAESGQLKLDRRWVPYGDLIHEVIKVMSFEAQRESIVIHANIADVGEVYCDPQRMKQVWINLLGNSIRYTPAGGNIKVEGQAIDHRVRITVTDTGPGIPPEHLPYLFHRFYRVEESRNRGTGGMGLGLSIAKELVEAHEGKLEIHSDEGQGTTYVVDMPVFPVS
jgi:two-component system sensor histidine kinase BaeS